MTKLIKIISIIIPLTAAIGCSSGIQLKKLSENEIIEMGSQALKNSEIPNIDVENEYGHIRVSGIKPGGKYSRLIETTIKTPGGERVNRSSVEDFRVKYVLLIESFKQDDGFSAPEIKGYIPEEITADPQVPADQPDAGITNELVWIPSNPRQTLDGLITSLQKSFKKLWRRASTPPGEEPPEDEEEPEPAPAASPAQNESAAEPARVAAEEQPTTENEAPAEEEPPAAETSVPSDDHFDDEASESDSDGR